MSPWFLLLPVAWVFLGNVLFRCLHRRYNMPLYHSILLRWARREGLEILEAREAKWWETTPFQGNKVFPCVLHLSVRDTKGWTRTGWVRVGHWLYGPKVDEVEASWDPSPLLDPESR
ncbi:MAG: hypothetical protein KIS92_12005 [Planctomycetota bacterium]|nr:hypothetical protein [Planctomycetota bacterium]